MIDNPVYQLIQQRIFAGQNMVYAALDELNVESGKTNKPESTKTEQYYRGMLDVYEGINKYVILLRRFEDKISKEDTEQ